MEICILFFFAFLIFEHSSSAEVKLKLEIDHREARVLRTTLVYTDRQKV